LNAVGVVLTFFQQVKTEILLLPVSIADKDATVSWILAAFLATLGIIGVGHVRM
jgi:hypothetical protein